MELYLYKNEGYFAISNSFLKLVEYLKNYKKISFNDDYAKALIGSYLCSESYKETLINEIELIPRNKLIIIDIKNKNLKFKNIDYKEKTIPINSIEGLKTLDKWYYKWINIIREIKSKTNNIIFELSGGFDSRIIMLFAICANIDLNKILVKSYNDNNHTHKEDYEIANQIAKEFNFKLNHNVSHEKTSFFIDKLTPLVLSSYIKIGSHNQFNFRLGIKNNTTYYFGGRGGETIRIFYNKTPTEYIDDMEEKARRWDPSLAESSKKIYTKTINQLRDEYRIDENSKDLTELIYSECRSRNHFGKVLLEDYYVNNITLVPFFDSILHSLQLTDDECEDRNLLIALIFIRYCPKLLGFKFEGGRKIQEKTIEHAKKINNIYPFKMRELEYISGPSINMKTTNNESINFSHHELNDILRVIYKTDTFKNKFFKYLPNPKLYNKIKYSIEHDTYFPACRSIPIFSVLKILDDINQGYDMDQWYKYFFYKEFSNRLDEFENFIDGEYIKLDEYNLLKDKNVNKEENNKLKRFNNDILTSNSWKITKPIRFIKNKIIKS